MIKKRVKRSRRVRQASTLSGSVLIGCRGAAEVAQRAQTAAMEKALEKFLRFEKLITAEREKLGAPHKISAIIISLCD